MKKYLRTFALLTLFTPLAAFADPQSDLTAAKAALAAAQGEFRSALLSRNATAMSAAQLKMDAARAAIQSAQDAGAQ